MPPTVVAPSILSFTVIAAVVSTVGALLALVLKEVVFAQYIDKWRTKLTRESVRRKYREPIVLASVELANRLEEISREYPTDFLASSCLSGGPIEPGHGTSRDAYFVRYKCQSTVYRLAALLGWFEIYRQELVFLDDATKDSRDVQSALVQQVRAVFADGHLLAKMPDSHLWSDALILREEQRAVGETMIIASSSGRVVMGYGQFVALLEAKGTNARWLGVVVNFLVDPGPDRDFRRNRYAMLIVRLVALIEQFEPARLSRRLRTARDLYGAAQSTKQVNA